MKDGKLKFTVPGDWTPPQGTNPSEMGYTDIDSAGGIDSTEFDEVRSATVIIFSLDRGQTIDIHYGWYPESDEEGSGGAMAPTEAGPSTFVIEVQGSDDEDSGLEPVKKIATDGTMTVNVRDQVSGGGSAEIDTGGDVFAGDLNRTIDNYLHSCWRDRGWDAEIHRSRQVVRGRPTEPGRSKR